MSHAELKKFEELKRLQKEAKLKKKSDATEHVQKMGVIQAKADSLPEVQFKRKGQFELIPDFLQKETKKDLDNIATFDAMADAQAKQDAKNKDADSGLSMAELFR